MDCNKVADVAVEVDSNVQSGCVRGDRGIRNRGRDCGSVLGTGGIDSSLLFFFLLLVVIVCQSDCGIELDTLLWFFLLLVVLYNYGYAR